MVGKKSNVERLPATLLLQRSGLVDVDLEVRALESIETAQIIAADSFERRGEYGRLRVIFRNPDGQEVSVPHSLIELRLKDVRVDVAIRGKQLSAINAKNRVANLASEEYTTLPTGVYEVTSVFGLLKRAIGSVVVEVGPGAPCECVVNLRQRMLSVQVVATDEWGVRETGGALTVTLDDGSKENVLYGAEWPGSLFVPEGKTRIGVTPSGGEPVDMEHVFTRDGELVEVHFVRRR